jgi:hypothetical protein
LVRFSKIGRGSPGFGQVIRVTSESQLLCRQVSYGCDTGHHACSIQGSRQNSTSRSHCCSLYSQDEKKSPVPVSGSFSFLPATIDHNPIPTPQQHPLLCSFLLVTFTPLGYSISFTPPAASMPRTFFLSSSVRETVANTSLAVHSNASTTCHPSFADVST